MATLASLTRHDLDVLEKVRDPESAPSSALLIDENLPRDPHILDKTVYGQLVACERACIASTQQLERQPLPQEIVIDSYKACVKSLDSIIEEHPNYASARNNRAQALRGIYGDELLVAGNDQDVQVKDEQSTAIIKILGDLSEAIKLLQPTTPWLPISPRAAKTLSQAYTQRGAIFYKTAQVMSEKGIEVLEVPTVDKYSHHVWTLSTFEEEASRDFMAGGRYGNEVAKALAVHTNPTSKLCGEMVKKAIIQDYSGLAV